MTENSVKAASAAETDSLRRDENAASAAAATVAEREARLLVVVRGATRDLGALLAAPDRP